MLNRTKCVVEDLKKAGFERKDFSARTKQDSKSGGWKDTEIHMDMTTIEKRVYGKDYLEANTKDVGAKVQHYMRKRFKNLVKNDTNENYRITEWINSKGWIWYTINTTYEKTEFQVHVGYDNYDGMDCHNSNSC